MKMLNGLAYSLILCAAAAVVAIPGFAYTEQRFPRDATITLKQARAKALRAHPGTIIDRELEKERGGSGLRYSFDIKNGATTHEVGIDARTGALLENSREGPHAD